MQILIEYPSVLALSQFRCEKYDKFESLLSRKLESSSFEKDEKFNICVSNSPGSIAGQRVLVV